jgi:hypothetical protein
MSDRWALETMKNTFSGEMVIFGTFDMPRTFPKPTYQNDISSLAFAKPPATLAVPANGDLREIKNESFVMAGRAAPNPPGLWPIIKKRISDRHQAGGIARGFAKGFAGGHDAYAKILKNRIKSICRGY